MVKGNRNDAFDTSFCFMILSNLTLKENGQKKFLNLEQENKKGIIFMKILDKFFENIYDEKFDFCSNIIANISSLKEGRNLILEYKIYKILLIHFDKMNNHKLVNILRIIRNCCFEYENYKEDILINDVYITKLNN